MVTTADLERLARRILELEGGEADGSEDDNESEEYTGYTDHGTDDEESDLDAGDFED